MKSVRTTNDTQWRIHKINLMVTLGGGWKIVEIILSMTDNTFPERLPT